MKVLFAMPYKGGRIYIRMFDRDLFTWDAVFGGELYSSYIVITPAKGRKTLTKRQIQTAVKVCYAGATTTIDMKVGVELDERTKKSVEMFEKSKGKELLN